MAVAFLLNEKNEVLLLKKRKDAEFLAGLSVPIGGHIEGSEISNPKAACFREIAEETGLNKKSIKELKLKYIIHRIVGNLEIRTQYVFFGKVIETIELTESIEGSLEWVPYKNIAAGNVTETTVEIIKHYQRMKSNNEYIFIGSMKSFNGSPSITWCLLEDWEN